ncbi:MAG TPA: TrkA family potassium uptake protein [Chloroflexia bacterium]
MAGKDFAVIGLGRFGSSLCRTLRALGHDVLGIDQDMAQVQEARPIVTDAVQLDATDEEALRSIGIAHYDAVVVAIGVDVESSILITLLLKEIGVRRVVAKAGSALQQRVLAKVGADVVVFPEADAGYRVAHTLVYPAIADFLDLGEDFVILQVPAQPEWAGRTLAELGMAGESTPPHNGYSGLQVQVLRRGTELICAPRPAERVQPGDVLAVVGRHEDLARLVDRR